MTRFAGNRSGLIPPQNSRRQPRRGRRLNRPHRQAAAAAVLALATLAIPAAAAGAGQHAVTSTDWPAYEHGSYHRSTSYGDPAITPANAATLHAAWTFTAGRSTATGAPGPSFDASPVVANGVAYIGSRSGIFTAIRISNGTLLWRRQLDFGQASQCPARGTIATANVLADPVTHALTVYAPGSHYLYALNPQTGAVKWKTAIGPATPDGEQHWYNWSSPTVVGGKIYLGLGSDCDAVKIRGGEVQLDQHTGKLLHSWYDVPAGVVGGTVWSSSASDGKSVWVSTGNPASSATQVYDAYSVVRLDAATFTKQDKWTGTFPLGADLDFGSSPTLFVASLNGVATNMVGACNKNGVYYAWRAAALSAGPGVGGPGGHRRHDDDRCLHHLSGVRSGRQHDVRRRQQPDHRRQDRERGGAAARSGHRSGGVDDHPAVRRLRLAHPERHDARAGGPVVQLRGHGRSPASRC